MRKLLTQIYIYIFEMFMRDLRWQQLKSYKSNLYINKKKRENDGLRDLFLIHTFYKINNFDLNWLALKIEKKKDL